MKVVVKKKLWQNILNLWCYSCLFRYSFILVLLTRGVNIMGPSSFGPSPHSKGT